MDIIDQIQDLIRTINQSFRQYYFFMSVGKNELRDSLRSIRWNLSERERAEKSEKICRHLADLIKPDDNVLVYCAKEPEVDTCPIIDHLLGLNIPVAVPLIQKEDVSLRLSLITTRSCLVPSTFSVPEPLGNEIPASPEDITTVILPMLGFDRSGSRLGYGAGYYDRFLSRYPHMKRIGLAFACQEIPSLPIDPYDILMDEIVTESGVITCGGRECHQ